MSPSTPAPKEESEAPIISYPGTYDLENVSIGCRVFVRRPLPGGAEEERKAEVLSIRDTSKKPIPRASNQSLESRGNEIYRHEDISFFEIDGRRQMTWCRNLSLLSKCFLDHKTLYYDVQPFMYYCMVTRDQRGCHLIGYFSKEKESAEGYNVACILTLPQYQRHGYGKLLIEFSYALSKRESKVGSPEKPLSDLGLLGYRAYWAEAIIEVILNENLEETTFDEISAKTSIKTEDILYTCMEYQLIKWKRNIPMICLTDGVKEQYAKAMMKRTRRIMPEKLVWKPLAFTRDQLRFGW